MPCEWVISDQVQVPVSAHRDGRWSALSGLSFDPVRADEPRPRAGGPSGCVCACVCVCVCQKRKVRPNHFTKWPRAATW